jgi:anthranilate phosphoribosyltransferase
MRRQKVYWIVLVAIIVSVWEYKVVEFNDSSTTSTSDAERILNQQGAEGWELTATAPSQSTPRVTLCYLRRAKYPN